MPKQKRTYAWFIEPLDSHSNEVLAKYLRNDQSQEQITCGDGMSHDVWECSAPQRAYVQKSISDRKLKVRFWRRTGGGQIEAWPPVAKKPCALQSPVH